MSPLRTLLTLALALILFPRPALGCIQPNPSPEEKFNAHQVVVLAHPVGVLNEPEDATVPSFIGPFQQSIRWRVLVSWKGPFGVGDIVLTRASYNAGGPCGSGAVYTREPRLLYVDGTEPFETLISELPISRLADMKYLSER